MISYDKIKEYIDELCDQVRWKKAHPRIKEEMRAHIIDARDAYIAEGMDKEAATERAIAETGDATVIGAQFDQTHRPSPQWGILAATAGLLIIGILIRVFVFRSEDYYGYLSTKLIACAIGVAVMLAAYFFDFSMIGKYPRTFAGAVLVGVVASGTLLPQLNRIASFQIVYSSTFSEFTTLLLPLALSAIIYACKNNGYRGILLSGLASIVLAGAALYIRSLTGLIVFMICNIVLMCVATHKQWFGLKRVKGYILMIVPIAVIATMFVFYIGSSGFHHLVVAVNPSVEPAGAGYFATMTKELLGGTRFIGRGTIPEQYHTMFTSSDVFYTNLLLTSLIVRLGWIAFAVILGLFMFFIVKSIILCMKQKSGLGMLISLAVVLTFSMQVVYYVAYNLGFQFSAPLSLPLISNSGSAVVINMALIGLMLSVFRTGSVVRDEKLVPLKKKNIT